MKRVIVSNLMSQNDFYEGSKREIDWHNVDAQLNEYAIEMLNSLNRLLFGHVAYEFMASYWPIQDAINNDPVVAER